jgi:hypothetical protein
VNSLADLRRRTRSLDELTRDAYLEEVLIKPLDEVGWSKLQLISSLVEGSWAFIESGDKILAVDLPSRIGERNPMEAVVFPPTHSQLLGWYLFHAWRSVDLLSAGLDAASSRASSVMAIISRALIEELGCLASESLQIHKGWETAKLLDTTARHRAELVQNQVGSTVRNFAFATRMSVFREHVPNATNVLTYVKKLDTLSRSSVFSELYDWLADSSHPALGARLTYVTDPLMHQSGATTVRAHSRARLQIRNSDGTTTDFEYPTEMNARRGLELCGPLLLDQLCMALRLVDDFGLTTSAAAMTKRIYWRNFLPVAPESNCPCGCGPWAESLHRWGAPVPVISAVTGDC